MNIQVIDKIKLKISLNPSLLPPVSLRLLNSFSNTHEDHVVTCQFIQTTLTYKLQSSHILISLSIGRADTWCKFHTKNTFQNHQYIEKVSMTHVSFYNSKYIKKNKRGSSWLLLIHRTRKVQRVMGLKRFKKQDFTGSR